MDERRLLLAVALSLLVLTAYSLLFPPQPQDQGASSPPPSQAAPATSASASASASGGASDVGKTRESAAAPAPAEAPASLGPAIGDDRERRVEVSGPAFSVAFSNKGARLVSWKLTRYKDARGGPEEMVPAAGTSVRPLDVETGMREVDERIKQALFEPSADELRVTAGAGGSLGFEYRDDEIEVGKSFEFHATGLVTMRVEVKQRGRTLPCRILWGPGIGNPSAEERKVQGYVDPQGVALTGSGVERRPAKKLAEPAERLAGVRWAGVESHYFTALFVATGTPLLAELRPTSVTPPGSETALVLPIVAADASGGQPLELFVGAKDYSALKRLGLGLERVVPVGDWLGPIVVPLMSLLRLVHGYLGNWGWSIVALTVLINLAMAPLRHYSVVNGIKMAKLGPEMRQIQERYRKVPLMDPRRQQMQEEIGALYARHGMNMGSQMMVGCLPLLLTMPFLFAFYRVLTVSVELRGASFLWIGDLAQKDPLFITPVLMAVSMYVMQRLTPSTLDPAQQRMMMLMPLILGGMFLAAPAGLNLYWLTSNLWSILQQSVSLRLLQPARAQAATREKRPR
jgi:YidC/Oxa1 family membrane protein insertase